MRPSLARMTPVGAMGRPIDAAEAIYTRLRLARVQLIVFVDAGRIFAPASDCAYATRIAPASIIGVYTRSATFGDIAEDLLAWREEAMAA